MTGFLHKNLAEGRWYEMSLMEQLGNIGSEVGRARIYQERRDGERLQKAADMALELFDLTLTDRRWKGRLQEIGRARDVFCDVISGGKNTTAISLTLSATLCILPLLPKRSHFRSALVFWEK